MEQVRTEHALSPEQLFVAGALQLCNFRMAALDFFENIQTNNYGVTEEGLAVDDHDDAVVVPENKLELSDEHFHLLQQHVNPFGQQR